MALRWLSGQLGHPAGLGGRLVTNVLNRANRKANAAAVRLLDVRPGDRALDVGFGGGVGLAALLATPAGRVVGVEASPDMVRAAEQRFAEEMSSGRLELVEGNVSELPFPDASFERIISIHTLYFWPDPEAGMRELARVLGPGGRLVLGIGIKAEMEKQRIHRHGFCLYDGRELESLLTGAGLRAQLEHDDSMLMAVAST
jgi:SAM-dependent methyltransferase